MRARVRFERDARSLLEAEGFHCMRSAGSRGPVDLFALRPDAIWFIQVKSTKDLACRGSIAMFRDAVLDLLAVPMPPYGSRWLFVRKVRGGWYREQIDQWPTDRVELARWIREVVAGWDAPDAAQAEAPSRPGKLRP